jgi:hypothetical protein
MPIISPVGGAGGGGAYTQLADSLLIASAASFDFQAISGNFNHLKVIIYGRSDTAAASTNLLLRFNNDSAANYDWENVQASDGGAPAASESLGATAILVGEITGATATANYFAGCEITIPEYKGVVGNKVAHGLAALKIANTTVNQQLFFRGGGWRTTATAVTRVTILPAAGNFIAGSHATLYGLL